MELFSRIYLSSIVQSLLTQTGLYRNPIRNLQAIRLNGCDINAIQVIKHLVIYHS